MTAATTPNDQRIAAAEDAYLAQLDPRDAAADMADMFARALATEAAQ